MKDLKKRFIFIASLFTFRWLKPSSCYYLLLLSFREDLQRIYKISLKRLELFTTYQNKQDKIMGLPLLLNIFHVYKTA
jgi:hypothetical protein